MSYVLILDNDDKDPQIASNSGWKELCEWSEEYGDIEIEYFCEKNETGDAQALKEELMDTLSGDQEIPPSVKDTLKGLLSNLKQANTAYVSNGIS